MTESLSRGQIVALRTICGMRSHNGKHWTRPSWVPERGLAFDKHHYPEFHKRGLICTARCADGKVGYMPTTLGLVFALGGLVDHPGGGLLEPGSECIHCSNAFGEDRGPIFCSSACAECDMLTGAPCSPLCETYKLGRVRLVLGQPWPAPVVPILHLALGIDSYASHLGVCYSEPTRNRLAVGAPPKTGSNLIEAMVEAGLLEAHLGPALPHTRGGNETRTMSVTPFGEFVAYFGIARNPADAVPGHAINYVDWQR